MTEPAENIASLVRVDEVARVLAMALRALPEGCAGEKACADPAVIGAVTAAARIVQAYPLPLDEVLPGLRLVADRLINPGELQPRFRNALFRDGIRTWGDLAQRAPDALLDIRGFGHGSIDAITHAAVAHIVTIAVDAAHSRMPVPPAPVSSAASSGDGMPPSPEWLALPLRTVARWAAAEREAVTLGDILWLRPEPSGMPPEIAREWERARCLDLRSLIGGFETDLASLTRSLLDQVDERRRHVLISRTFAAQPRPYPSLARELGISRERVRQLEDTALNQIAAAAASTRYAPLRWRAASLRKRGAQADIPGCHPWADRLLHWLGTSDAASRAEQARHG
jgi:hypothetical protein